MRKRAPAYSFLSLRPFRRMSLQSRAWVCSCARGASERSTSCVYVRACVRRSECAESAQNVCAGVEHVFLRECPVYKVCCIDAPCALVGALTTPLALSTDATVRECAAGSARVCGRWCATSLSKGTQLCAYKTSHSVARDGCYEAPGVRPPPYKLLPFCTQCLRARQSGRQSAMATCPRCFTR